MLLEVLVFAQTFPDSLGQGEKGESGWVEGPPHAASCELEGTASWGGRAEPECARSVELSLGVSVLVPVTAYFLSPSLHQKKDLKGF